MKKVQIALTWTFISSGDSVALPPVVGRASPQGEALLRKSLFRSSLTEYGLFSWGKGDSASFAKASAAGSCSSFLLPSPRGGFTKEKPPCSLRCASKAFFLWGFPSKQSFGDAPKKKALRTIVRKAFP